MVRGIVAGLEARDVAIGPVTHNKHVGDANGDAFGSILGGFTLAPPPAFLQKAFDLSVYPHNEVRVSMDFIRIAWAGQTAVLDVDRVVVPIAEPAEGAAPVQCSDSRSQWAEVRVPVDHTFEHHDNLATVRIEVDPATAHWGIDGFRLLPLRRGYFDDFQRPAELADWSGPIQPLFTTHCGDPLNSILGGFGFAGQGAYLERVYDLLAMPHSSVRITLDFYKIDSWGSVDAGVVTVDGEEAWRQTFTSADGEPLCGGDGNELVVAVDEVPKHDRNVLTLRISAELGSGATGGSFGVDNVSVEPICDTRLEYGPDGVPTACLASYVGPGGGGH